MAVIQVRGLSERAHRLLKARAALEGKSLSEYIRLELEEIAALPTREEILARVGGRDPVGGESAADAIRAGREGRSAA